MAHQADSNVVETVIQLLCENGLSHMAEAMRIMLNESMRIERSRVLEAEPYQRSESRKGYANGFKPKTITTRMGALTVQIPQVRGDVEWDDHAPMRSSIVSRSPATKVTLGTETSRAMC